MRIKKFNQRTRLTAFNQRLRQTALLQETIVELPNPFTRMPRKKGVTYGAPVSTFNRQQRRTKIRRIADRQNLPYPYLDKTASTHRAQVVQKQLLLLYLRRD